MNSRSGSAADMNLGWERLIYRFGWDSRCRNFLPAHLLRPLLTRSQQSVLLDVGSGNLGVAEFLPGVPVVGIDLEASTAARASASFLLGSVLALPFSDRSFPAVSCIDVLEHLSLEDRSHAIAEIMRVTSGTVLIACPHGEKSRACDDEYRRATARRNRPIPGWVDEHLRQPYPEEIEIFKQVQEKAAATGRSARISVRYCESIGVSRLLRMAASRSDLFYVVVNLLFGLVLRFLPAPGAHNSYRLVMLVDLTEK